MSRLEDMASDLEMAEREAAIERAGSIRPACERPCIGRDLRLRR
jgi:hypothetical protein